MRFHSANIVRIHWARSGTSMPASRSTAIVQPELVVERADPVVAVHQHQHLARVAVLGELLGRPVHVADHRLGARDDLAVELEHHAEHAVRRRVLRPDVEDHLLGLRMPGGDLDVEPAATDHARDLGALERGASRCRPSPPILRRRSTVRSRQVAGPRSVVGQPCTRASRVLRRGTPRPRPAAAAAPSASAGHRGWKRQPAGIRVGSGGSPASSGRSMAAGSGTTSSSARVYGCIGG